MLVRAKSLQSCPTLCDPHGLCVAPARLLRPWDSPGKDTGVGGHALLQGNACAGCNEVRGTPGQWFGPPRTDGLEVRESCPEGTKENREHGTRGVGGLEAAAGGRMLSAPSSLCSCGPQASVFHLCQLRMLRTAALPLLRKGGEDDMLLHPLPDQGPEHHRDAGGLLILLRPPASILKPERPPPSPRNTPPKTTRKMGS